MTPSERRRLPAADLHVHTTHSDGVCTPGAIVRAAASVGLSAVAITDHDTISAIPLAREEAALVGIELIPGIEITAEASGKEIHILGHFVSDDHPALISVTQMLRTARSERIESMAKRLSELGFQVDLGAVRATFPRATIGRKHLADWLVRTGQVSSAREAFTRFLGDGGPASVAKPRLPWREAIDLIQKAGGVAGLAHPPHDLRECELVEYKAGGLGAIEISGLGASTKVARRWCEWASKLDLVPIAGTDFHAPDRPGQWVGSRVTEGPELQRLRSKAKCLSHAS